METVNKNLDDLEDNIDDIDIPQNDLQALLAQQKKQKVRFQWYYLSVRVTACTVRFTTYS